MRLPAARGLLGVLISVLMLLPPATAAGAPGGDSPSLNQYVESVPTADGDQPTPRGGPAGGSGGGGGGGGSAGSSLPPSVRSEIRAQGGADADQLEAIAGSPALGAPAQDRGRGAQGNSGRDRDAGAPGARASSGHRPSAVDAVATAATSGGEGASTALVGGLVLLTAAMAFAALARRRSLDG